MKYGRLRLDYNYLRSTVSYHWGMDLFNDSFDDGKSL